MPEQTDAEHGAQVRTRLRAWKSEGLLAVDRLFWKRVPEQYWVTVEDQAGVLAFLDDSDKTEAQTTRARADLIAHAPADLARLLDRAERAESERDEARRHVNTLVSEGPPSPTSPEPTAEPRHALTCDHLTGRGLRECKPGCPAYTADPYLRGADA